MKSLQVIIIMLLIILLLVISVVTFVNNKIYNKNQIALIAEIQDIKATLKLWESVED